MTDLNVACIQMDISHCNKQYNIDKAVSMSEKAAMDGAHIIVLPEVFSTGFCYENMELSVETYPYPTLEKLAVVSKTYDCTIIGSIIEKKEQSYYNLGFCIESGGFAGFYRKTHPFGREKSYFSKGDSINPVELQNFTVGLVICYELRFPEIARKLTLSGSDVLVTIAEFPDPRINHWYTLVKARSIENQVPHIACNRTGSDPYSTYSGGSMIIDAWGNVKADAGNSEAIIFYNIDLDETSKIREKMTVLSDRRTNLYW
ncbi:carbon-nitrogen family hydrolase [Methanohalobium sp.]|uniref:carbon-nitrogen family hydrolase n=1 Tax=Methanohalobium sp. TaxID=2837493 RepID=UPI0025F23373|nr:carbon-nitrogen family hydrolase [Methanohalobium sp.]